MNVEEAYSCPELRHLGMESSGDSSSHALQGGRCIDIIHDKGDWYIFHVVGKGLAYTVVHINLSRVRV
jgi:hypothetical protein